MTNSTSKSKSNQPTQNAPEPVKLPKDRVKIPREWDSEQLWLKAIQYIHRANEEEVADQALWYALALELLARSALTSIHPVLNADPEEEGAHILYAFGFQTKPPKSIPIHAVFSRLEKIDNEFRPHRQICNMMIQGRNQELHTGESILSTWKEAEWLASYFAASEFLCRFQGKTLKDYLGKDITEQAHRLISMKLEEQKSKVKDRIAAHKRVFEDKSETEKTELKALATKSTLFRKEVSCPACQSPAAIDGEFMSETKPFFDGENFCTKATYLASSVKCSACGLKLNSIDEIHIAEISPRFTRDMVFDLHENHTDQEHMEYDNM